MKKLKRENFTLSVENSEQITEFSFFAVLVAFGPADGEFRMFSAEQSSELTLI